MRVEGTPERYQGVDVQAVAIAVFKDEKADDGFLKELDALTGGMVKSVIDSEELKGKDMLAEGQQKLLADKLNKFDWSKGAGPKQVRAYSLCDGTRSQTDIAKALTLVAGNFSRTVSRWIDSGIVFRLGEGREAKLLHVYPLSIEATKKKGGSK